MLLQCIYFVIYKIRKVWVLGSWTKTIYEVAISRLSLSNGRCALFMAGYCNMVLISYKHEILDNLYKLCVRLMW